MTENDSTTTQSASTPPSALASGSDATGRWVPDPDDPEFEVWEPWEAATVEKSGVESSDTAPMKTGRVEPLWNMEGRPNQCVGHKKNGERCRRAAIAGGTVCRVHGGAAPAVKAAARVRLEMAADRMAANLLGIAVDDEVADGVRLAATNSALDRAGLSAKTAVEVEVGPSKGFEQILGAIMTGGSRAESRSRRGESADAYENPEDDWTASEVLDAQIVDSEYDPPATPRPAAIDAPRAVEPPTPPTPATGLMDLEDALDQLHRTAPPPQAQGSRNRRSR